MWVTGGVPVTQLRKMMLEELQRLNYSEETIRSYIHAVEDFSRRFNCSPDRLGPRHIREYQAELFHIRKLSSGTVAIHLAALRFFYTKTLKKGWSIAETPYPKKAHRLPAILSQEEVAQLIDAACPSFHRTILMTLYATGARCAELTHLKFSDVDSKRPSELASRKVFIRTRFDTVLRPIYSRMVPTCAPFRSCWVITIRKRRLTTCISPSVTCMRPRVHWIHCRSKVLRRGSTRWPGHHSRWPI